MMTNEQRKKLWWWGGYIACLVALGVGQAILENRAEAQRAAAQGYVLSANEGETIVRPGGNIVIKVDPQKARPAWLWELSISRAVPAFRSINTSKTRSSSFRKALESPSWANRIGPLKKARQSSYRKASGMELRIPRTCIYSGS